MNVINLAFENLFLEAKQQNNTQSTASLFDWWFKLVQVF